MLAVTESAARAIGTILATVNSPPGPAIRLCCSREPVSGSKTSYSLAVTDTPSDGDEGAANPSVIEIHMDPTVAPQLSGKTLDAWMDHAALRFFLVDEGDAAGAQSAGRLPSRKTPVPISALRIR